MFDWQKDCPVQKQTPDSRLSSWQAIISVQKETIFSTLVRLNSTNHWSICNEHDPGVNEDISFHSIYNSEN